MTGFLFKNKVSNSKTTAFVSGKVAPPTKNPTGPSLIRRFMDGGVKKEQELNMISEIHRIQGDEDRHIVHMTFSLNKCLVFMNDFSSYPNNSHSGQIKYVSCRESFV